MEVHLWPQLVVNLLHLQIMATLIRNLETLLEERHHPQQHNFCTISNSNKFNRDQGKFIKERKIPRTKIYCYFSRVNLTPSPQAASHQNLNNGQKFYYQLQSSLSALSGANTTTSASITSSSNESPSLKNSSNAITLNHKAPTDYVQASKIET